MSVILNRQYKRAVSVTAVGCMVMFAKRKEKNEKRYREKFNERALEQEKTKNYPDNDKINLRMDIYTFDLLFGLVKKKVDTVMPPSMSAEQRLIAILIFLATDRSYEDLKFTTGIGSFSVSQIISETCKRL